LGFAFWVLRSGRAPARVRRPKDHSKPKTQNARLKTARTTSEKMVFPSREFAYKLMDGKEISA
jgi:hypothetical protein